MAQPNCHLTWPARVRSSDFVVRPSLHTLLDWFRVLDEDKDPDFPVVWSEAVHSVTGLKGFLGSSTGFSAPVKAKVSPFAGSLAASSLFMGIDSEIVSRN